MSIPYAFKNNIMATNNYLFVYGTLLKKGNKSADFLKSHCSLYAEGRFKGLLYNLEEYPGAVSVPLGDDFVYGSIFTIDGDGAILRLLDDYECFGDDQPQPNEFVRELINVETDNGVLACWVYLYNLGVKGLDKVESGKYI